MSEMVERVARAMCDRQAKAIEVRHGMDLGAWNDAPEPMRESWRRSARAAIEAMRELTDRMVEAWDGDPMGYTRKLWQAMIDEALIPSKPGARLAADRVGPAIYDPDQDGAGMGGPHNE